MATLCEGEVWHPSGGNQVVVKKTLFQVSMFNLILCFSYNFFVLGIEYISTPKGESKLLFDGFFTILDRKKEHFLLLEVL